MTIDSVHPPERKKIKLPPWPFFAKRPSGEIVMCVDTGFFHVGCDRTDNGRVYPYGKFGSSTSLEEMEPLPSTTKITLIQP